MFSEGEWCMLSFTIITHNEGMAYVLMEHTAFKDPGVDGEVQMRLPMV